MFFTFKNYVSMKDKKYCISHRPENWSEKFGEIQVRNFDLKQFQSGR